MELPAADTAMALSGIAASVDRVAVATARLERTIAAARADIVSGGMADSETATAVMLAADALAAAAASRPRLTGDVLAALLALIPPAHAAGCAALRVVRS